MENRQNNPNTLKKPNGSRGLVIVVVFYGIFLLSAMYIILAAFEIIDRNNAIKSAERTIRDTKLVIEKWNAKDEKAFTDMKVMKEGSKFDAEIDNMTLKEVQRFEESKLVVMKLQRSYFRSMRDSGAPRIADYAELKYLTGLCKLNVIGDHVPIINEFLYAEHDHESRGLHPEGKKRCFYKGVSSASPDYERVGDPWILLAQFRLTGQFGNEILISLILMLSGGMGALLRDFVRTEHPSSNGSWFIGLGVGFLTLLALKSGRFLFLIPGEAVDLTTNPYGGAASALLLGLTWRGWLPGLFERLAGKTDERPVTGVEEAQPEQEPPSKQ